MKAYNPCMPYVITRLAEREGFEPSVPRKVQQISSLPRSTTPAPLQLSWITHLQCFALPYNRFHSLHPCNSPFGYCSAICKSSILTICRVCPAIPLIHEFHPFGAIAPRCSNSFQTNLSTTPAPLL